MGPESALALVWSLDFKIGGTSKSDCPDGLVQETRLIGTAFVSTEVGNIRPIILKSRCSDIHSYSVQNAITKAVLVPGQTFS